MRNIVSSLLHHLPRYEAICFCLIIRRNAGSASSGYFGVLFTTSRAADPSDYVCFYDSRLASDFLLSYGAILTSSRCNSVLTLYEARRYPVAYATIYLEKLKTELQDCGFREAQLEGKMRRTDEANAFLTMTQTSLCQQPACAPYRFAVSLDRMTCPNH
jgi:hypothetical protein